MTSTSHIITIPTKQHDGGNDTALKAIFADGPKPKVDAFAKYSNNLIRMKTLLLLGDNEDDDDDDDDDSLDYLGPLNDALRCNRVSDHAARKNPGDATKRRKGNNSQPITHQGPIQRKTRLSFEIHPDLLLHHLLDFHESVLIPNDDDDAKDESKE